MLLREEIRHNNAGAGWIGAMSGLLSHGLGCLLITHIVKAADVSLILHKAKVPKVNNFAGFSGSMYTLGSNTCTSPQMYRELAFTPDFPSLKTVL
jgi:hypothetical protein